MHLRWRNGFINIGPMMDRDAYGFVLAWGRRSLLEGKFPAEGEWWFADRVCIVFCTGRERMVCGSIPKAIAYHAMRKLGIV